jgi:alpha-1,3-rhamnosyltransferase
MDKYKKGLCSVCCLGYNHASFISDNIHSIWNGDYKQVEIIAIDDGSKDNSAEILQTLAKNSPCPMTVIVQENSGKVGKNFNIALNKASGEYVTFIAMDDYLYPDALSKKIKLMSEDKHLAFIANASITKVDTSGKIIGEIVSVENPKSISIQELLELEYNAGSFFIQGCVIRTDIASAFGGFDDDMIGDDIVLRTKLFLYLSKHSELTFLIFEESACYYRFHETNVHKNVPRLVHIISEYLERYWPQRELPVKYLKWTRNLILLYPFDEYIKELTFNRTSLRLMKNPRIQKLIKMSQYVPFKWRVYRLVRALKHSQKLSSVTRLLNKIKIFRKKKVTVPAT